VINSDTLKPPNPNCSVCGVMQSRLIVDPSRATLNDLVEDVLKTQLGYGDEFSINNEVGTLYDPDLDDNLSKKFVDLGVKKDSFLTVIDDEEENPRVNLSLSISEKYLIPWHLLYLQTLILADLYRKTPSLFKSPASFTLIANPRWPQPPQ
jgi:ubiquitin-like 1-activating enzyme E1 B